MHEPICGDGSRVDGEGPHEADKISLEESLPSAYSELIPEALRHALVLEVAQLVRLHEGLHVIEGIIEHPVTCSTDTSGDDGHVDRDIVLVDIRRCQLTGKVLDDGEIETESGAFTDSCGSLASIESLDSVLFKDLDSGIQ